MYDSLNIWQNKENLKDCGYLQKVPTLLRNTTHSIRSNGIEYITGYLDNLLVSVSENGLSIKGSLNKFWYDDNFCKLTRQEAQHSIEKLQDLLQVNLLNADIKRLDIAHNFIMNEEVKNYYNFLGDCNYYKRLSQADSIYYNNGLRTKLFYDKVKEGKTKGAETPQIWQKSNVLRYELRFMKRLPKQFKKSQVLVSDLFDENFYINTIDSWINEYVEIKKNRLLTPNIDNMTSKNSLEYLLSAYIEKFGKSFADDFLELNKNNFSTTKEASRSKKKLKELKGLTEESPLMKELDSKILRVKEYYR
ncbi:phage/plasmid replication protein [Cloacibacterium sp.]|uniref:phage/plasmid replication domain-containing protein n=1 Tax=Cloacibacterium sp. TaxID=1913682 RepID=UPI0035B4C72C